MADSRGLIYYLSSASHDRDVLFVRLYDSYNVVEVDEEDIKVESELLSGIQNPDLILFNPRGFHPMELERTDRFLQEMFSRQIPVLLLAEADEDDCWQSMLPFISDIVLAMTPVDVSCKRVANYIELKRYRCAVNNIADTDLLTGVANRSSLEETLAREWKRELRRQTPISLILAGVDCFGAFNEQYGFAQGDGVLCKIAGLLQKCVQRETDFIARFGADEFACLLIDTDNMGAVQVAKKIVDMLDELYIPHAGSSITDHITMSFGLATLKPSSRYEYTRLIQDAKMYLEQAKRDGHNRIRTHKNSPHHG